MKIACYVCGDILVDPGAIVVSPPLKCTDHRSICNVHKYHICCDCWKPLLKHLNEYKKK